MSIVLQGFGLDVDSQSSIVAFGLTVDPQTPEEAVAAIHAADITQLYVVDFGGHRRKPTAAEFRRFRRIAKKINKDRVAFRQRKGRKSGQIETEWYLLPSETFSKIRRAA